MLDSPACSLVTVLIMLYHLQSVPNKMKFGQEICGHKLGFITGDKQAQ